MICLITDLKELVAGRARSKVFCRGQICAELSEAGTTAIALSQVMNAGAAVPHPR